MIRRLARRRADHPDSRRPRSQGGYALLTVVLMIGLTSLGVSALLGLLFTATAIQGASATEERELRALDGAMDAAINQMRFDPQAPTINACQTQAPVQRLTAVTFDNGTTEPSDDVPIQVACVGTVTTDRGSTADQVRLVGINGYPSTGGALSPNATGTATGGGALTTLTDSTRSWAVNEWAGFEVRITSGLGAGQVRTITSNTATVLTVTPGWLAFQFPNSTSGYSINVPGATPWTEFSWPSGVDVNALRDARPSLVHRGPAPLQFGSGVTVRNTAAVLSPADTVGRASAGAAFTVTDSTRSGNNSWTTSQWRNYDVRILSGAGAGQIRTVTANSINSLTVNTAWTVNPGSTSVYSLVTADAVAGTATAGAATTLTDSTRLWSDNQWAGYRVRILSGAGTGQVSTVTSNTTTALTVSPAWATAPNNTSAYAVFPTDTANGTASSATSTTLADSTATWSSDQWAGREVRVLSGPGAGQFRTVTSNTGTALTVSPAWTTAPTSTSTYAILRAEAVAGSSSAGQASAGATTTLTDSSKAWVANQWNDFEVRILSGTGAGQVRTVASNSSTALTVSPAWATAPNNTSYYALRQRSVAIESAGEYIQGRVGPGGASGCNQLSVVGPMRIRDLGATSDPQCEVADADLELDDDPTSPFVDFPSPTTPPAAVPVSCTEAVVPLTPGRYNSLNMTRLNQLVNRVGGLSGCDNKTFHFAPGVYVFTGDRLVFDRPGSFFVMGVPKDWTADSGGVAGNSTLVNDVARPLCDTSVSGVTFALPPQFRLEHRAATASTGGRLSMCPKFSEFPGQPPLPAIYQRTSYENATLPTAPIIRAYRPSLAPTTCLGDGTLANLNPPGLQPATPQQSANLDVLDGPGTPERPFATGAAFANPSDRLPVVGANECRVGRTFSTTVDTIDPRPLTSARLLVTGYESVTSPANFITDRRVMVTVRKGGQRICTTAAQPGIGNGGSPISIDLLTGSCAPVAGAQRSCVLIIDAINPRCYDPRTARVLFDAAFSATANGLDPNAEQRLTSALLADATLDVTQYLTFSNTFLGLPIFPEQTYTVTRFDLVTNGVSTQLGDPSNGTPNPPFLRGFDDPGAVKGAGLATPQMPANARITATQGLQTDAFECQSFLLCPVLVPPDAVPLRPTRPFVHQINLGDASVEVPDEYRNAGVDPNLSSLRLRLRLVPDHCPVEPGSKCRLLAPIELGGIFGSIDPNDYLRQSYFGTEVKVRVAMTTYQGTRCVEANNLFGSTSEVMVDLMKGPFVDGPGCDSAAVTVDSLEDLRLTSTPAGDGENEVGLSVQLQLPCLKDYVANASWRCVSWVDQPTGRTVVFQIRPPSIDDVSLFVSSDTITAAPLSSRVTINARTPGPGVSTSSFNVYGKVWMPRSNLDVLWNGDVTEGVPLVQDELLVGSLGSVISSPPIRQSSAVAANRYLVCCTAAVAESRDVKLVATAPSGRKLFAQVHFDDLDDEGESFAGYRVEIRNWQTCDEGRETLCTLPP
jgi:hypothetical protein